MISSKEEKYFAAVDAREKDLTELSKKIWGYAIKIYKFIIKFYNLSLL